VRRWLMFAAIGMLWSTLVRPTYADEMAGRLAWYGGAAAADLAATEYALSCGAEPMLERRDVRVTLKMAQVGGMMWLDGYLAKRDRKLMWTVRVIYALANIGAAYHSMREARR
jgi:hypothetical protein